MREWFSSCRILVFIVILVGFEPVAAGGAEFRKVEFNNPGLVVDLGVGLWAWPLPMDYDGDGDYDLVVSCPDKPSNGIYFFENPGGRNAMPVFKKGVRVGRGYNNIQISFVDGEARVLRPAEELVGFRENGFAQSSTIYPTPDIHDSGGRVRANQWKYCDYEGDGDRDLIVGVGDWEEYGWDYAFNEQGIWTNGPLRGFVYLIRNEGTDSKPDYSHPEKLLAGGKPIDVYGMPSPNLADFDGDGDLDLLCGEFVDSFTYFENIGTRSNPRFSSGRKLLLGGSTLRMDLCMIVPVAIDWDKDGDVDLVVGQEDGRVAFLENEGNLNDGLPQFLAPRFFQQEADHLKFGALVTPFSFDWDGDGDEDLICGNTAGYLGFIENLDGGNPPRWAKPEYLKADGKVIRYLAGSNGSIQGPCEAKWGYTTLNVADWNSDSLPDVVVNSIWGKVVWHRNVGSRTKPKLATEVPVEIAWKGIPPKPVWNWWNPEGGALATQWRTTPVVMDLNQDGLNDLVMLDHEGYLAFFEGRKEPAGRRLLPGQRVFRIKGDALVFDNANSTFQFDLDQNGRNDLVQREKDGSALYVHRGPDRREVLRSASRILNSGKQVQELSSGGEAEPGLLRLNAGFAGRSGRRKLAVTDWDQDGRIDLLVNSSNVNFLRNVSEEEGVFLFEDLGKLSDQILAGHSSSPAVVDWDKNGIPDLLVGAEDGFFYYLENPAAVPKRTSKGK